MKRKLLWLGLVLGVLAFLVYVLNETPIWYQEPKEYPLPQASALMSPEASPILQLEPKKDTLIIFFHSYASTPHDFKRAADFFSKQYNVVVPLYPGHGTSEADFQKTYFSQWYALARETYLKYRGQYARVYLCGFSMGGAIALKLGEEFNATSAPDGIITISAPVFFNDPAQGVWYDWRLYFTRFFAWVEPVVRRNPSPANQDEAGRVGYEGKDFPAQVHSLKIGLQSIKRDLPLIKCPVLAMQSRGDKTVPFENLWYIARHVSADFIRVRIFDLRSWEHTRHLLPLYKSTRDQVLTELDQFLNQGQIVIGPTELQERP